MGGCFLKPKVWMGILLWVLVGQSALAYQGIHFQSLTSEDGLSSNEIRCVVQDAKGFLWVATRHGLNRYDGYDVVQFQENEDQEGALPADRVRWLLIDREQLLWVATDDGLSRYIPATRSFHRVPFDGSDGQPLRTFTIFEARDGQLWVGTDAGLFVLDRSLDRLVRFSNEPKFEALTATRVGAITQSEDGILWIGTSHQGVCRLDLEQNQIQMITKTSEGLRMGGSTINTLFISPQQELWIGHYSEGFSRIDLKTGELTHRSNELNLEGGFSSKSVKTFFQDHLGHLWIGTWARGIYRYDREADQFINYRHDPNDPFSLQDDRVMNMYQDSQNQLWIGTERGLSMLNWDRQAFQWIRHHPKKPSIVSDDVTSLLQDKNGNVWVGTYNAGVTRIDANWQTFRHFSYERNRPKSLQNNGLWSVCEDKKGRLWFGTSASLHLYHPEDETFQQFKAQPHSDITNSNIMEVYCDQEGMLWLGMWGGGMNRFDPDNHSVMVLETDPDNPQALYSDTFTSILEDNADRIWFGSPGEGLAFYDRQTQRISNFLHDKKKKTSLPGNVVQDMVLMNGDELWIATDGGLCRFQPESMDFERIGVPGLEGAAIISFLRNRDQEIWLSHLNGISQFDPVSGEARHYDEHDGLLTLDFQGGVRTQLRQGSMLFATTFGVLKFEPENLRLHTMVPNVELTSLFLFNQQVAITPNGVLKQDIGTLDQLVLDHTDSPFTFEFAAINLCQSEKSQYAYMLEGIDSKWNTADPRYRRATYTHIEPGNYTFRVKAANHDGFWNEKGRAIQLRIMPPWYKTLWARIFFASVILFILTGIYYLKTASMRRYRRVLERQVQERTAEIVTKNREIEGKNQRLLEMDRFKENMTGMIVHDLKNPLNAILNSLDSYSLDSHRSMLRRAGRQMMNMVLNILDVQKFEDAKMELEMAGIQLSELVSQAIEQVSLLLDQKNLNVQVEISRELQILGDEKILERVLINLLTNAIKYSNNNQSIWIRTRTLPEVDRIQVEVEDRGEGIPEDRLDQVFEKFGQVQARSSSHIRSTGLGLTFCKMAVEAHGGQIGVQSSLSKGSRFFLDLPLAESINSTDSNIELSSGTEDGARDSEPIVLTQEERQILSPYVESLRAFMVYETTDVERILKEIDVSGHEQLSRWKQAMQHALYAMNEVRYEQLVSILGRPEEDR